MAAVTLAPQRVPRTASCWCSAPSSCCRWSRCSSSPPAAGSSGGRDLDAWRAIGDDPELLDAIVTSLQLAVLDQRADAACCCVPTMVWVHLRLPRLRRLVEFLCLLPLVIPAIVLVVGIAPLYSWVTYFLGDSPLTLTFVYVVLVLPYAYRALDSGLTAIDLTTLSEAARSLGAGWGTVLLRVVLPNIRGAVLSARAAHRRPRARRVHHRLAAQLPDTCRWRSTSSASATRALSIAVSLAAPAASPSPCCSPCRWSPAGAAPPARSSRCAADQWKARMTSGAGVHLVDLRRSYGGVPALDGLDLRARAGRARLAARPVRLRQDDRAARRSAGLETADRGQVLVGGKDVTGVPANRRDMGMVFQAYSLFPQPDRARQRRASGCGCARRPRRDERRRADELLELVGLGRAGRASTRTRCPAVSSSASRWPARWRSSRACCCSTSRCRRWTRRCGCSCATRSAASRPSWRSPRCSSRTTRRRRSPISDRVGVMSRGRLEQLDTPADGLPASRRRRSSRSSSASPTPSAGTVGRRRGAAADRRPAARGGRGGRPAGSDVRVLVRPGDLQVRVDGTGRARRHRA